MGHSCFWSPKTTTRSPNAGSNSSKSCPSSTSRTPSTRCARSTRCPPRPRRSCRRRAPEPRRASLLSFDELDGLLTGASDHHRAGVAKPLRLVEDADALIPQLVHPGVETAHAQGDVVIQVSPRAHQWLVPLAHVPGQPHIAEGHAAGRRPEHSILLERREGRIRPARHLARSLAEGCK